MAASASFGNATIMNTTEDFDPFCIKLPVGPLIWAVFSVICACVGVPASMWLLGVLVQRQRSSSTGGSSNNVYMLSLTIMDLIYNVFRLPDVLNYFVWRDTQFFIIAVGLEGLIYFGRPLFMACSCVDCYMAVVHPIKYMKISQSRYRLVVCALVWALTLLLCLLLTYGFSTDKSFWYFSPCVCPIFIIAFCDIAILRALRKPDPSGRSDVHPQKQRALQTITNSFVMTLVSYLPSLLVQMFGDVIPLSVQEVYCSFNMISVISTMLGSSILPLLYLSNLGSLNNVRVFNCLRSLMFNQKH